MPAIDAVVFDLGKVLIDYSYDGFFKLLNSRGGSFASEADFVSKVDLLAYEHGHYSDAEFLRRINACLANPLPEETLVAAWKDLFTPVQPMLALAKELKQRCRVYLLSNTSAIHWAYLQETYSLAQVCHDLFASFQVGRMKPAAEIFAIAEQRFGLGPQRTLFIDDRQENVAGAIACGWQGLWHRDFSETRQVVLQLVGKC